MKKLELVLPIRITPTTNRGGGFVIKDSRGVGYSFYTQEGKEELEYAGFKAPHKEDKIIKSENVDLELHEKLEALGFKKPLFNMSAFIDLNLEQVEPVTYTEGNFYMHPCGVTLHPIYNEDAWYLVPPEPSGKYLRIMVFSRPFPLPEIIDYLTIDKSWI